MPSKPTANPPGGSWVKTEPSYTSGSTNSLYFTDLTVFTDASFSYSDVSLSSSYEAAKAAYNKAMAAQENIENLTVGGRNYILRSSQILERSGTSSTLTLKSSELIPAGTDGEIKQKTEDLVGPYELHDFFLYHLVHSKFRPSKILYLATCAFAGVYTDDIIRHWLRTFLRRFFSQQFKRSCMPDGPKVCSISLSPRGDWRMPSDATAGEWLNDIDNLPS